jgi:hypothetical protein
MEQPIKQTRQEFVGKEFCALVAQTDFVSRYYELCRHHPLIDPYRSFSCPKKEIFQILTEIGQTPQWDVRDKSYSFDFTFGEWSVYRGFVLQRTTMEFAFSAQRGKERVGSNYAVIARAAVELIEPEKIPNPPFPRPVCYSHDELCEVLRECFKLSDLLCSVLEKIPKPTT